MRFIAALVSVALTSVAQERSNVERCYARCAHYVVPERERQHACRVCLTAGDDGAWLLKLSRVPEGAAEDADWQVRWGALRLEAQNAGASSVKRLATLIATTSGDARRRACLTAVHAAGAQGKPLSAFLSASNTGDPSAVATCVSMSARLAHALEPDLFETSGVTRREALEHLAIALDVPPARLLLDAMATRSPEFDPLVARSLIDACARREEAAGRALLEVATPGDAPQMNRLLAVFARTRDAFRERVSQGAASARLEAVHELAPLAPLSEAELTSALADEAAPVRLAAALALARGEGRTLADAARARLSAEVPVSAEQRVRWVELLGGAAKDCAMTALFAFEDARQPNEVRVAGLEVFAECEPRRALERVERASASSSEVERVAATRAAAHLKKSAFVVDLVTSSLSQESPPLLAAAARAAGAHHLIALTQRVDVLAGHPDPSVRAEALKALASLSAPLARLKASSALAHDPVAAVRVAAAISLGLVGGPQALQALTEGLNDESAHVKLVAAESLRKLGNGSVQP